MVCKNCGAQNKDYFVYCKECSALLIEDSANAQDVSPSGSAQEAPSSPLRIQPVFESRRPSVSAFKENARKQAEVSDATVSRAREPERRYSESLYGDPTDYAPQRDNAESQERAEATDQRAKPSNRQDYYEDRVRDILRQYELQKMSEGPYYDPKARHHALDPWELLDEEQTPAQTDIPSRESVFRDESPYRGDIAARTEATIRSEVPRREIPSRGESVPRSDSQIRAELPQREAPLRNETIARRESLQRTELPAEPSRMESSRLEPDYAQRSSASRERPGAPHSAYVEREGSYTATQRPGEARPAGRQEEEYVPRRPYADELTPRRPYADEYLPPRSNGTDRSSGTDRSNGTDRYGAERPNTDRYNADRFASGSSKTGRRGAYDNDDEIELEHSAKTREPVKEQKPQSRQYTEISVDELRKSFEQDKRVFEKNEPYEEEPVRVRKTKTPKQPEFDADDDYEAPRRGKHSKETRHEPAEKRTRLFTVLFWVVIAALIGTLVWYGISYVNDEYGSVKDAVSSIFGGGNNPTANRETPIIEETEYDGKPAHTIIVSGKDGEQVYFKDLDKTFPITGGAAKLKVVDLNWIPEEPATDSDTLTVTPQIVLIDRKGNEIPLTSPSFTVKVPTVPFTLSEPSPTNGLTVDKGEVVIAGTVTAGSHTRIYVDDNEITDIVNEQGAFSYVATLPGHGDFTINVIAKLPRYKSVTIPITVSYPRKDVNITFEGVPARTEDGKVTVKGTMDAGSTISVDGSIEGDVTSDSAAGTFSFVAKLGNYGRNDFKITATAEGVTTEKSLLIIRTPNMEDYTSKALALDYAALAKNPVSLKGKVYRFEGTVKQVISTDQTTILIFNVGTEAKEKLLKLEYFGTSEMKEGSSYRVFGGVLGKDEDSGLPFLSAHFVYKP